MIRLLDGCSLIQPDLLLDTTDTLLDESDLLAHMFGFGTGTTLRC